MRCVSIFLLTLLMTACSGESPPATAPGEPQPIESGPISAIAMAQWTRSCALCHVRGEGGAPVLGDKAAWAPRIAQGEDVLFQHAVEGLNNMPPLGYCMDCEADDFREIIRFMAGIGS